MAGCLSSAPLLVASGDASSRRPGCAGGVTQFLAVRPWGSGVFFLPGGVPEQGETLAQATAREVREEDGRPGCPDFCDLTEVVRVEAEAVYGRPGVMVELVCFSGPGEGDPVPDGQEIVELVWLEPVDWQQFAPAVRLALREVAGAAAAAAVSRPRRAAEDARG